MPAPTRPVRLFIGSSSEGQRIAANLQDQLETRRICEVVLWAHVFEPSGYVLPSLLEVARDVDYAVLIATPDDMTVSRGAEHAAVRDNVILEFGLFAGALGLEHTFLLATSSDVKLPSDVFGLTRLHYTERSDNNIAAALNSAVLAVERVIMKYGHINRNGAVPTVHEREGGRKVHVAAPPPKPETAKATVPASRLAATGVRPAMRATGVDRKVLHQELELLYNNAVSQGWTFLANNKTTLRLVSPKGRVFVMSKSAPAKTREDLRDFAAELNGAGLRVNMALLKPPAESPFLD